MNKYVLSLDIRLYYLYIHIHMYTIYRLLYTFTYMLHVLSLKIYNIIYNIIIIILDI